MNSEENVTDWFGLYGGGWGDILNPEAFAHPAKVAPGLAQRIYEYAIEQGYLQPGDRVVDPFGGIGGFAYHALLNDLDFVGVELEQNFVDLSAGCDCDGFTAVSWQRMFGRGERFRRNERAGISVCPRCANDLNRRPSRPEYTPKNGRAKRRNRMKELGILWERKPQYADPLPLPGTKAAKLTGKKQLSLFDMPAARASVYEQNSGRIPTKQPHRYQGNIERWMNTPGVHGTAVILQGDSRKLADVVRGWAEGAISSPPYAGNRFDGGEESLKKKQGFHLGYSKNGGYGDNSPGQLGNMPEGEFSAAISSPPFGAGETRDRHNVQAGEVASAMTRAYTQDRQGQHEGNLARLDDGKGFTAAISSPPYADSVNTTGNGIDWGKAGRLDRTRPSDKRISPMTSGDMKYGTANGQLGAMKEGFFDSAVSSPPYADAVGKGDGPGARHDPLHHNGDNAYKVSNAAEYGRTPGNLGNLDGGSFSAAVSSPPWENTLSRDVVDAQSRRQWARENGISNAEFVSPVDMERVGCRDQEYGRSSGNVGNEQGETFWLAAKTIVEQVYEVLKPGGVAIWVTKRFVRDGSVVPFSDQWEQLCAAVGFVPVDRIRAWLIEDKGVQLGVFGEHKDKSIKRASFFRRLYEKKYPQNAIEWEDVIVMIKPEKI